MHIPEKLKVGGHWYKVTYPYHYTERGDRKADCDAEDKQIRIDNFDAWSHNPRPESSVAVTFLHEILHACDYLTGHGLFRGEDGERKVEGLSEALFQVLRDNKLHFDEV
jgi:hypothetical protein